MTTRDQSKANKNEDGNCGTLWQLFLYRTLFEFQRAVARGIFEGDRETSRKV
jgi:hypothetical protein